MDKAAFDQLLDSFRWPEGVEWNDCHARHEDMSPHGILRVLIQEDGDAIVGMYVDDAKSHMPSVEFCSIGCGGGRSPRVVRALKILAAAIALDNQEYPITREGRSNSV